MTGERWEDALACSSSATTDGSPILLLPKTVDNSAVEMMHDFCVENKIFSSNAQFFGDTVEAIPTAIVPASTGGLVDAL